jgi:hypothetical protein
MGGEIQWPAVPWLAELYGVVDLDGLVELLLAIRKRKAEDTNT